SISVDPRFYLHSPAFNTFYIVDDGTCKLAYGKNVAFPATVIREAGARWTLYSEKVQQYCSFGMYYLRTIIQNKGMLYRLFLRIKIMEAGIFNKLKKLISKVRKGVSWMNNQVVKPILPVTNALLQSLGPAGSMVAKGISAANTVHLIFG
ncbi:MAG: hypothetical protein EZS28_026025, partial [Streblomastix strix]